MFTSTMPFRIQVDEALDAYSWMKQVGTELMNFYFIKQAVISFLGKLQITSQKIIRIFLMKVKIH
jgi:hypothetical protein